MSYAIAEYISESEIREHIVKRGNVAECLKEIQTSDSVEWRQSVSNWSTWVQVFCTCPTGTNGVYSRCKVSKIMWAVWALCTIGIGVYWYHCQKYWIWHLRPQKVTVLVLCCIVLYWISEYISESEIREHIVNVATWQNGKKRSNHRIQWNDVNHSPTEVLEFKYLYLVISSTTNAV